MPETIDLSRRVWGQNYNILKVIDGGQRLDIAGWSTPAPEAGDFLILKDGERTTRYQAESVKRCWDPKDMFFAELVFAPRTHPSHPGG